MKKGSAAAKKAMAKLRALRNKGRSLAKRAGLKPYFFSRKKRPRSRKSFHRVSSRIEPLIIKEGVMGKRKRKSSKRRYSGFGRKRRSSRRRYGGEVILGRKRRSYRRYHGAAAKFNPVEIVTQVAGLGAGAIAGSTVAKFIPIPAKLKGVIPIALGLVLPMLKLRGRIMEQIATGSIAVGTISLLRNFLPAQIPMLAGSATAEEIIKGIQGLPEDQQVLLGYDGQDEDGVEVQGQPADAVSPLTVA